MKTNLGKADRIIRIVLGVAIAAAGYELQAWWGFLGLIPFATAFIGFCPAYKLLGLSTTGKKATTAPEAAPRSTRVV